MLFAGGFRRISNQPLEHGQIFQKAAATELGKTAGGVRPVAFVALAYLNEPGFLQHLEVPAEVAVGEPAELLEISERQSLRMRRQRGQQAEPRLLMDHPIEAIIGERRMARVSLRHLSLPKQNKGWRPSATGRSQTARPSSMAISCGSGSPAASPRSRKGNPRCPPAPRCAAANEPRQTRRGSRALAKDPAAST